MFKAARIAKIKEILLDRGRIDVSTLSSLLNVTEVTIRSDLELLEQENYIIRTHGGAILNEDVVNQQEEIDSLFHIDYDRNKDYIGRIAADMIDANEWVFLGQGTTCYFIAKALKEKPRVNVVTNNLLAAATLSRNNGANIVLLGGELTHENLFTSGDMFLKSLENIFISKAFMTVTGIDFQSGYTVSNVSDIALFSYLKNISKELIIVADSSKFGKTTFRRIGDLGYANTLITNEDIDERYKSYFFENNIKLFTTYQIKNSSVGAGE